jgi:hypothetical protein
MHVETHLAELRELTPTAAMTLTVDRRKSTPTVAMTPTADLRKPTPTVAMTPTADLRKSTPTVAMTPTVDLRKSTPTVVRTCTADLRSLVAMTFHGHKRRLPTADDTGMTFMREVTQPMNVRRHLLVQGIVLLL